MDKTDNKYLSVKEKRQKLRKNQTYAEYLLWSKLRNKQLRGNKFYRQYSVGNFIVDFYNHEKRLVIELDGSQHMNVSQEKYDLMRTKFLNSHGMRVLRFWDNDVIKNLSGALEIILKAIS